MKKNVAIKFLGVMAAMVMAVNFSAFAVPSSEEVNIVSGDVSIARTESTLTFNVSSPKAIINFDSFNVDEGQHVIFSGSNSELLARVTGGEASFINGNITSDLLLLAFVNSAGINIGPNANITAPSLILSTRDITNVNFMGGDLIFEKVDSVTKDMLLLNRGTINITNGGFGVMIAGAVENQGVIVAKGGTIALAGGDAVKLEISPERRISVAITKETASYITDYDGNSVLDQIKNSGTLNADGGQILVRAESINDIFRSAINLEGIVSATKVEEKDGVISLVADGTVRVNTQLYATNVEITAFKVEGIAQEGGKAHTSGEELKVNAAIVDIISLSNTTHFTAMPGLWDDPDGEGLVLSVEEVTYIQEGMAILDLGERGKVGYLTTNNITLEVPRGEINTATGVYVPGNEVKLSAKRFGSLDNPVGVDANITYINRLAGTIDVTGMWGLGSTLCIRGPAPLSGDDINSWGAVTYSSDSHLILEAEKTTLSGDKDFSLYGDITFHNFELTTPGTTVYFEAAHKYTFSGVTNIIGENSAYGLIHLFSSEEGEPWFIDMTEANYNVSFVGVGDSHNIGEEEIAAYPKSDFGGNIGWAHNDTVYWLGTDIVDPTLWSVPANWNNNAVPGVGDSVIFNNVGGLEGNNNPCTIDVDAAIAALTIEAGYTQTITQSANLTITGAYTQEDGIFDGDNFEMHTGDLTLSGTAEFNAPSELFVSGDWTASTGTFNHNNGLVTFNGTSGQIIDAGLDIDTTENIFYDVVIDNSAELAVVELANSIMGVWNSLLIDDGTLSVPSYEEVEPAVFLATGGELIISSGAELAGDGSILHIVQGPGQTVYNSGVISITTFRYTASADYDMDLGPAVITPTSYGFILYVDNFGAETVTFVMASDNDLSVSLLGVENGVIFDLGYEDYEYTGTITADIVGVIGDGELKSKLYLNDTDQTSINIGSFAVEGLGLVSVIISEGHEFYAGNSTITVEGNWVNYGSFDPETGTVIFNGTSEILGSGQQNYNNVEISEGATLTGYSDDYMVIYGNWTNNGTFDANDGAVAFLGDGDQYLTTSAVVLGEDSYENSFFALAVFKTAGTLYVNDILVAEGIELYSSATFDLSSAGGSFVTRIITPPDENFDLFIYAGEGDVEIALLGGGDGAMGNVVISAANVEIITECDVAGGLYLEISGDQSSISATTMVGGDFRLNGGGTLDISSAGTDEDPFIVGGDFWIECGELIAGASYIEVGGDWINEGTFTSGTSSVTLTGGDQSIYGDTTFYNLSKTISGGETLYFEAGSTQTITNLLQLSGAAVESKLSLRSTETGLFWYVSPDTALLSNVDVQDGYNTGSNLDLNIPSNTNSGHNYNFFAHYTWVGGTPGSETDWSEAANWDQAAVPGDMDTVIIPDVLNDPVIDVAEDTVSYLIVNSDGSLSIGDNSLITCNIDNSGTISLVSGSLTVTANISNSGNLECASGASIYVAGNWSNTGTFDAGESTVYFNGENQAISGDTTFYNFSKDVSLDQARTLTFEAGSVQVVENDLVLRGSSGQLLSLRSSVDGERWFIDSQDSSPECEYIDVKDSYNHDTLGRGVIDPDNSTNSGHNWNWFDQFVWRSDAASSSWSSAGNWEGGVVPGTFDNVYIQSSVNDPALGGAVSIGYLEIASGGALNVGSYNLSVNGDMVVGGDISLGQSSAAGLLVTDDISVAASGSITCVDGYVYQQEDEYYTQTSSRISLGGNWSNLGDFVSGSSLVTFLGDSPQYITMGKVSDDFYRVVFNNSSGYIYLQDDFRAGDYLYLYADTIVDSSASGGDVYIGGVISGSAYNFSALTGTGRLTVGGTITVNDLILDCESVSVGVGSTLSSDVSGDCEISINDDSTISGTLIVDGDFVFNGPGDLDISSTSGGLYMLKVGGDFTLNGGSLTIDDGLLGGATSIGGSFYNLNDAEYYSGGTVFWGGTDIEIDAGSGTGKEFAGGAWFIGSSAAETSVTLLDDLVVGGSLYIAGMNSIDAGGFDIEVASDLYIGADMFQEGSLTFSVTGDTNSSIEVGDRIIIFSPFAGSKLTVDFTGYEGDISAKALTFAGAGIYGGIIFDDEPPQGYAEISFSDNTDVTLTAYDGISVYMESTGTAGQVFTITAGAGVISMEGDMLLGDGIFDPGTGTVEFNGTTEITSDSDAVEFHDVIIDTLSSLSAPGKISLSGDWTNYGDFTHNDGTVVLTGNGESVISGETVFYDLTCIEAGGKTIKFSDGTTQTVEGTLTIVGGVSHDYSSCIVLTNTSGSALEEDRWDIVISAAQTVSNVCASNSNAYGAYITLLGRSDTDNCNYSLDPAEGWYLPGDTFYWVAAGASGDWDAVINWAFDPENTLPTGILPGEDSYVVFIYGDGYGSTADCLVDIDVDILSLAIGTGYSGAFSTDSYTISVSDQFSMSGGTPDFSAANLSVSGKVIIQAGEFTAPGAASEFIVMGDFLMSGGTYSHSSGEITFEDAGSAKIIVPVNTLFNDVYFAGGTYALGGNMELEGNLEIADGAVFNAGTYTITIGGDWINNGDFGYGTSTVMFSGASTISGTPSSGDYVFYNLGISSEGVLTSPDELFILGNWTNEGTFTHNSGTVYFSGSAGQSVTGGESAFFDIVVDAGSSVKLGGNLEADGIIIDAAASFDLFGYDVETLSGIVNSGYLYLKGNETVTGGITNEVGSTVVYNGTGTYTTLAAGESYYDLIFSGSGSWTMAQDASVAGDLLVVNDATLNLSTYNLAVTGDVTIGAYNQEEKIATIIVGSSSGAGLSAQNITISAFGRLICASAGNPVVTVYGNWENSGTSDYDTGFTAGAGTVNFAGTVPGKTIESGDNDYQFFNISFTGNGGAWTLSDNMTVTGAFSVTNGSFISGANTVTISGASASYVNVNAANTVWTNGTLNIQSDLSQSLPANETYNVLRIGRYSSSGGPTVYTMGNGTAITTPQASDGWTIDSDARVLLTVAWSATNKEYDGTTDVSVDFTDSHIAGFYENFDLDYTAAFENKNVADGKTVNITGITITGSDSGKYILSSETGTALADITPKELTVGGSFTADNKVYDGSTTASFDVYGLTLTGVIAGEEALVLLAEGDVDIDFDTKDAGLGKTVSITDGELSGAGSGNYTLSLEGAPTTSADITEKELTVAGSFTANDKVYDGTTTATMLADSLTLVGVVDGETVTLDNEELIFAQAGIGADISVSVDSAELGGADAANYTLSLLGAPTTSADITAKELTIGGSFTANDKVYDGTVDATMLVNSLTLTGVVDGETVTLTDIALVFAQAGIGTDLGVTIDSADLGGDDMANYTLSLVGAPTATADITAKELTISGDFTANNKVYDGGTAATFLVDSLTLSGVVDGDDVELDGTVIVFADANVDTGIAVSIDSSDLAGADSGNYSLSLSGSPTAFADITPKELTVSGASADNKVYDGTLTAHISGGTLEGVVGDDTVGINARTGAFVSKSVGIGISVTASLTITGADSANYYLTQPEGLTADITAKELTVTGIEADNKVYDGNSDASLDTGSAQFSGIVDGDDVEIDVSLAEGAFDNKNAGIGKTVTVSGVDKTGADADNYYITQPSATADITPKELTVADAAAENKVYDGTLTASITGTLEGVIGADDVDLEDMTGEFAQAAVGTDIEVSAEMTISGDDAGNYELTQPSGLSADITPKEITVGGSFFAADKGYDGTVNATILGNALTLVGLVSGDTVSLSPTAVFEDKNVGDDKVVSLSGASTITGADSSNYTLSLVGAPTTTADIYAAELSMLTVTGVTADNKVYDGGITASLNLGSAEFSGVLPGDEVIIVTAGAVGVFDNKNVGDLKTVTIMGIDKAGADAGNYYIVQPSVTASITPKTVTLGGDFTVSNKVYDRTTAASILTNSLTVTGEILGDDLTVSPEAVFTTASSGIAVPVVLSDGTVLSGRDAGNYTLSLDGAPSTTANITARTITVTGIYAENKVYDGTVTAVLVYTSAQLSGVISGDTVTLNQDGTGEFSDKNVGEAKTVSVSGLTIGGASASNYSLTQPSTTASITVRALSVIDLGAEDKVYDGTTTAVVNYDAAELSGLIGGDDVTLEETGAAVFSNKNAGELKLVSISGLTISGDDSGNYDFTSTAEAFADITPRPITVTAQTDEKVYDGTISSSPLPVVTSGSIVDGDTANFTQAFDNKNVGTGKTISPSGSVVDGNSGNNYDVTFEDADTGVITVRTLNLTVTGNNKVYDGGTGATVVMSDDRVAGDVLTFSYNALFPNKRVEDDKVITVSSITISGGVDAGNYELAETTLFTAADITPKTLTVTGVSAENKIYDGGTSVTLVYDEDEVAFVGVVEGDDVTIDISGITGYFSNPGSRDRNTVVTVIVSGITKSGIDADNYIIDQPRPTATIEVPPTITDPDPGDPDLPDPEPGEFVLIDFGFNFINYDTNEEDWRKKWYASGKYRTVVIVYEGRVVAAPYDESGVKYDEGVSLTGGEGANILGELKEKD